jgi:hypothetical protein
MAMDRIEISWNEFRKMHKGIPKKEISDKWKLYKNGEYDVTTMNESQRNPEESKKLANINKKSVAKGLALRNELY